MRPLTVTSTAGVRHALRLAVLCALYHGDVYRVYFDTESSAVPPDLVARFEGHCGVLHRAIIALLRQRRIRGFSVRMVLTNDIAAAVRRECPPSDEDPRVFTPDRLAGTVSAKTFFPRADGEPYTIIESDEAWAQEGDDALAHGLSSLSHELGHCAIDCCRRASGYTPLMDNVTAGESASREIAFDALDEYRADWIADLLLRVMGTAGEGDEAVPLGLHHLAGNGFTDTLRDVLSREVYPGWPDRVQAYRERLVTLVDMWMGLGRSGWETFVLIAHTAAVARAAGDLDPITAGEFPDHPAVSLYIGGPWERLLDIAESASPLCTPAALAKMDARASTEAVDDLLNMWGELGLKFTLRRGGLQHIQVRAPARLPDG